MTSPFSTNAAVDFHVVNSLGRVLYTSPDRDLAKSWAKRNATMHPGLQVEEVTVTTSRRRVYKPAPPKAATAPVGLALARVFA